MTKMTKKQIVGALGVAGVALAGVTGILGHNIGDNGVSQEDINVAKDLAYKAGVASVEAEDGIHQSHVDNAVDMAFQEGVESVVPVVETITLEVEVPVADSSMESVVELLENHEDIDLLDDLKESEITTEVVGDRAVEVIDAISMAESLVKADVVEYIDDEEDIFRNGDLEDYRAKDVYRVTIDSDDSEIDSYDFDDSEYTIMVEATLKLDNDDDRETVDVIAEVDVIDGVAEIVGVELKD